MGRIKKKNSNPKDNVKRGSKKSKVNKRVNLKTAAKDQKSKFNKIKTNAQLPESSANDVAEDGTMVPKKNKRDKQSGTLRERMQERLKGAHFRFLNEKLYTADGQISNKLFKQNPEAFKAYHTGFQQQVQQWEFNPLDQLIINIKKKNSSLTIADFGCGDARLAQSVENKVHSFDLVALNEFVTACDMAHTPLPDASVDIAVFCLSLMGTNLSDFILEANRVLKIGGSLKIAEVESRFEGEKGLSDFIYNVTKYGFKATSKNLEKTYFYFMDFKKEGPVVKKKGLPALKLKPCIYKKR